MLNKIWSIYLDMIKNAIFNITENNIIRIVMGSLFTLILISSVLLFALFIAMCVDLLISYPVAGSVVVLAIAAAVFLTCKAKEQIDELDENS